MADCHVLCSCKSCLKYAPPFRGIFGLSSSNESIPVIKSLKCTGLQKIYIHVGLHVGPRLLSSGVSSTCIWVMHKCIMVKVGGDEIHIKYVKSRGILIKDGGKIFQSRGKQ